MFISIEEYSVSEFPANLEKDSANQKEFIQFLIKNNIHCEVLGEVLNEELEGSSKIVQLHN
jgi:hypothetical protein